MVKYLENNDKYTNLVSIANEVGKLVNNLGMNRNTNKEFDYNICSSPLSILLCSIMIYPGMDNNTKKQFEDIFFKFDKTYHEDHKKLLNDVHDLLFPLTNNKDDSYKRKCEVNISNNVYMKTGFFIKDNYLDIVRKMINIRYLDFDNKSLEQDCKIINDQISEDTKNNIKDLLKPNMIQDAIMVLVNALYFSGQWLYKFNEINQPYTFNTIDAINHEFPEYLSFRSTSSSNEHGCYEDDQVKVINLDYADQEYAMLIVVPKISEKDGTFEINPDLINCIDYINKLKRKCCQITMPKWTQRTNLDLTKIFSELGVSDMFDPNLADFSKMSERNDLFISTMIHEAFIENDKNGTKATAATVAIPIRTTSIQIIPEIEFKIDVNNTFAWQIYHIKTGMPLFQGIYDGPTTNKNNNVDESSSNSFEDIDLNSTSKSESKSDSDSSKNCVILEDKSSKKRLYDEEDSIPKRQKRTKCFGTIKKPTQIYMKNGEFKPESWFYEEGISIVNASYCEFCANNKCENKVYKKINSYFLINAEINCDCKVCNN